MYLFEKIQLAQDIIRKAYIKNNGKIFISFSGGKDSTILKHIAQDMYPNITIVFSNTTNEISDVFKYVKSFDNIIHVTPRLSFTKVIEKYGFPLVSKEVSQKVSELKHTNGAITRNTRFEGDLKGNGKLSNKWRFLAEQEFDVTHKCCKILKKDPLEKWAKENEMQPVIALMQDESMLRKQLALFGDENSDKIYPFLRTGWTEQDIWDYATIHDIKFADCYYDRTVNGVFLPAKTRTGCEYCAFGIHLEENNRFQHSMVLTPKRYSKMMKLSNNGITFKTAIDLVLKKENNIAILDLYGLNIDKYKVNESREYNYYFLSSTIKTKKCNCGSKKISFLRLEKMNFFDSPDERTGHLRNIWMDVPFYSCEDCNKEFNGELHMFNSELRVTNRLIDYVYKNSTLLSSKEIQDKTNLSPSRLFKILDLKVNIKNENF